MRIFDLGITDRHPSVLHFALHELDGQIVVYYEEGKAAQRLKGAPGTTFIAFLECNASAEEGSLTRSLLYHDVPKHFTWDRQGRIWRPRRIPTAQIGRVYNAHPASYEKYYTLLFLCRVPGAIPFESLRKLDDGTVAGTFEKACRQRRVFTE